MSRAARTRSAAIPRSPTTPALWANSVMGSWRSAQLPDWRHSRVSELINRLFALHYKEATETAALRDHRLGDARYSEGLFVDRTPELRKSAAEIGPSHRQLRFQR